MPENARSALECGGLTPPCSVEIHADQQANQGISASHDPGMDLDKEGGVKPPHSKVPSAQPFSRPRRISL
jgi:hypothetical protein